VAFFSKNQLEILTLFISHPTEEFHLSKIGEILQKSPGVFQRGINSLEKEGILGSKKQGNQRIFNLNKEYVLFDEIKSIVNKTYGAEGLLRHCLIDIKEIKTAFIFGSYVKNKLTVSSDIDLLLVVENSKIEDSLLNKFAEIEKKLQREINYRIYLLKEYLQKKKLHDPFLDEILHDDYILLKGEP
jgi:predicted nucleotidyltransferase